MEDKDPENTDKSSLKPVSSLRSHFEDMIKSKPPPPSPGLKPKPNTLNVTGTDTYSRGASLDIPRPPIGGVQHGGLQVPDGQAERATSRTGTPKLRPLSMGPLSPPRSPPLLTVNSPPSPPRQPVSRSPFITAQASHESLRKMPTPRAGSPTGGLARPFKLPSRAQTPALDSHHVPSLVATPSRGPATDPQKPASPDHDIQKSSSPIPSKPPPPINRAGKPKAFVKPNVAEVRQGTGSLAPGPTADREDERVSPFSTPPSENESFGDDQPPQPPRIPEYSKPKLTTAQPPPRDNYFAQPGFRYGSMNVTSEPSSAASEPAQPTWVDRMNLANHKERREDNRSPERQGNWTEFMKLPTRRLPPSDRVSPDADDKPNLPPRRDTAPIPPRSRSPRSRRPPPPVPAEPPIRKSVDVQSGRPSTLSTMEGPGRASMDTISSSRPTFLDTTSRFQPPPKRNVIPSHPHHATASTHQIPASRSSIDTRRTETQPAPRTSTAMRRVDDSEDEEDADLPVAQGATLTDYPDSSQANRRPPRFRKRPHDIATKYETKLFAICGEYICTSGYITKVWNLLTGELIMHLPHGDTVKVTAVAFKPASAVEDEGKRIWLGTNMGELHEIDIPSQNSISSKSGAHARVAITKIHRVGSEMWTLDAAGTLMIWPPGDDGLPSLDITGQISRIPKDITFSLIVGQQLWAATGREIMIYQPNATNRNASAIINKPLVQPNVGEVTAGAMISSKPDLIYFGHMDGKVTIYNQKDFSFVGVVNVSLYKISCLQGVGDYLWAAFNTGMIYVYDTSSQPWIVKKDWRAHENTIASVAVDRTSIWKLDRLQVASLGTDNMLKIWDGMLEADWLEYDMQQHDAEFCDFRELTALVMTWNAGAVKPHYLRSDEQDNNFLRDLLRGPRDAPDFVVFGFQELVDLEDKKVTAKNLFKSSKKKDSSEKEHMAKQYRAWRDHLTQQLSMHTPSREPYTLLHTADLVGLFTCVFVKTSLRSSITEVDAAEVKLGMKGRYGNKGALIVRFLLDDSSMCFINCHLAAGQKHTVHRNNDIAAIMEASALSAKYDAQAQLDMFVSGGDGSMVLDHEICILNGDLNYRIDAMSRDLVIREVQAGNLQKLLDKDQLLLSRKRNPGFRLRAFQEKEITFAPTYKYDVGTDHYDTSEKKRSPAWCDRLLYRGMGRIKQTEYRRHEVRVSDHRPVSGMFRIRAKTIDRRRQAAARGKSEERFEEVRRRIAMDIKLDYLVSVLGLTKKEAQRSLKQ